MPTPEEINKIAREYALKNRSALSPAGHIDFIINDFIEQLSKDYCIVEKSKIIEKYNEVKTWRFSEYFRGRFQVLKELFGTALFNEEKE